MHLVRILNVHMLSNIISAITYQCHSYEKSEHSWKGALAFVKIFPKCLDIQLNESFLEIRQMSEIDFGKFPMFNVKASQHMGREALTVFCV